MIKHKAGELARHSNGSEKPRVHSIIRAESFEENELLDEIIDDLFFGEDPQKKSILLEAELGDIKVELEDTETEKDNAIYDLAEANKTILELEEAIEAYKDILTEHEIEDTV